MPADAEIHAYYAAALIALRFVEQRQLTGRRFGPDADARWSSLRGELTTADRIDLLIRDADAQWPEAFGARTVFAKRAVAEDEPFGADWEPLEPVDAEALWRTTLAQDRAQRRPLACSTAGEPGPLPRFGRPSGQGRTKPGQGRTNPVKGARDPVKGARDPVKGARNPVKGARNPVKGAARRRRAAGGRAGRATAAQRGSGRARDLPAPVTRRKPKVIDERQLGLPTIPVAAPVVATPTPAPARASSVFGSSDILAARAPDAAEREQVANAVELLLARSGVMSADAFAAAMGVMGFRVGGYVSRFSEILNIDGYEVLRMDHASKQIHLDREKLAQLFEVKG